MTYAQLLEALQTRTGYVLGGYYADVTWLVKAAQQIFAG